MTYVPLQGWLQATQPLEGKRQYRFHVSESCARGSSTKAEAKGQRSSLGGPITYADARLYAPLGMWKCVKGLTNHAEYRSNAWDIIVGTPGTGRRR